MLVDQMGGKRACPRPDLNNRLVSIARHRMSNAMSDGFIIQKMLAQVFLGADGFAFHGRLARKLVSNAFALSREVQAGSHSPSSSISKTER